MFFFNKKTMLAASVAVLMPVAAQAATIAYGDNGGAAGLTIMADVNNYTEVGTLVPGAGNQLIFNYVVAEELTIPSITLSATGSNGGSDLGLVTFDYFAVTGDTFSTIITNGPLSFGGDFIPGSAIPNPFAVGDTFSLTFNDGTASDVGITATFITESVSQVPVPAAGLMLGAALLGGGIAARRKAKKA